MDVIERILEPNGHVSYRISSEYARINAGASCQRSWMSGSSI
jgi:hypothetical protein